MKASNNVIREEFLLLTERLKLDTQFLSQEFRVESLEFVVKALESKLNTFLTQDLGQIYVGPYTANWQYDKTPIRRLSNSELEAIEGVYKNLFLPDRQIKFIGVDLDDCLYDVTPIRHLLVEKIHKAVGARFPRPATKGRETLPLQFNDQKTAWALYNAYKDELEPENIKEQKASAVLTSYGVSCDVKEMVERTYQVYKNFSRLASPEILALYKPYDGVKDTLKCLMSSGNFIVGILTNGSSRFQRNKLNLLGLKEGEHFNFVMVSEDIGIGKPFRRFFEIARERASRLLCHSEPFACHSESALGGKESPLLAQGKLHEESRCFSDEECLILEDQVKNISGADGWLKVQFLQGYHSNVQPGDVQEVPKYGIKRLSILPDLLKLEKDSELQATVAGYFILKVLLLLHG